MQSDALTTNKSSPADVWTILWPQTGGCVALQLTSENPSTPSHVQAFREDIEAAQGGDMQAAARLIETYRARIARLVYAILLNSSDVDDVTQQVFVRMCQRIGTLRDPELFEAWLHQLARRLSLDFLRREKFRRLWSPLESLFGTSAESTDRTLHDERGAEIRELLARLSVSDRELILLAGEGYTYEEIARLQNRSRASVKARLARVREWLRTQLSEVE
jgi:RNA polymerase sigma-70 factor, ECF subfamily